MFEGGAEVRARSLGVWLRSLEELGELSVVVEMAGWRVLKIGTWATSSGNRCLSINILVQLERLDYLRQELAK